MTLAIITITKPTKLAPINNFVHFWNFYDKSVILYEKWNPFIWHDQEKWVLEAMEKINQMFDQGKSSRRKRERGERQTCSFDQISLISYFARGSKDTTASESIVDEEIRIDVSDRLRMDLLWGSLLESYPPIHEDWMQYIGEEARYTYATICIENWYMCVCGIQHRSEYTSVL